MSLFRSKSKSNDNIDAEQEKSLSNIDPLGSSDTIHAIVDDTDIENLNPEYFQKINTMQTHPLGELLLTIINKINSNDKSKINLKNVLQTFTDIQQTEDDKINKCLLTSTTQVKNSLIDQELSFHLINPKIKPPDNFSPDPTIKTTQRYIEVLKVFPKGTSRFTGERNSGPTLLEFLHTLNELQNRFLLSESEFLTRLLASTTRSAYMQLSVLIRQGDNVSSIYDKLSNLYDFSLNADQAREMLMNLKASKNDTFSTIQSKILQYSTLVGQLCLNENDRKLMSNFEGISALPRCFPPKSCSLIRNQLRLLMAKLHRTPTYMELISFLNPYKPQIDLDIKYNGTNQINRDKQFNNTTTPVHRFNSSASNNRPRNNNFSPKTYQINMQNNQNKQNKYTNNYRTQNTLRKNTFLNTKHCLLCGANNHTAADTCYRMKLNGKTVANITPTQSPCPVCKKLNKTLFHPETYCFNKHRKPI